MKRYGLLLTLTALLLTACGGTSTYATKEDFQTDTRYRRDFSVSAAPVCEAARRVLRGDGYIVENNLNHDLVGTKEFPIEENRQALLRMYVNCSPRGNGSTLFATATEEHFDVKTSSESTSIGIPLTPLSIGSKKETHSLAKTHGETVTDHSFYQRFYRAIEKELAR
jgi:hypothetical protein